MIVTEEEAKTKLCQETFAIPNSNFHCVGSACMAWSWWMSHGSEGVDRTKGDDNSKGFCGKAIVR